MRLRSERRSEAQRAALSATSRAPPRLDTNVARVRRTMMTAAALAAALALAAPAARAGQVVWLAANARGGKPAVGRQRRRHLPAPADRCGRPVARLAAHRRRRSATRTSSRTPARPCSSPTRRNTPSPLCALPCARAFSLTAGVLRDPVTGARRSAGTGFESQPRLTASGSARRAVRALPVGHRLDARRAQRVGALPAARSARAASAAPWAEHRDRDAAPARRPDPGSRERVAARLGRSAEPLLHRHHRERRARLPVRDPPRDRRDGRPLRRSRSSTTRRPSAPARRRCRSPPTGARS